MNYLNILPLTSPLNLELDYILYFAVLNSLKTVQQSYNNGQIGRWISDVSIYCFNDYPFWDLLKGILESVKDISIIIKCATEVGKYFKDKKLQKRYIGHDIYVCLSQLFEWTHKTIKTELLSRRSNNKSSTSSTNKENEEAIQKLRKSYEEALFVLRVSKIEQLLFDHLIPIDEYYEMMIDPNALLIKYCNSSFDLQSLRGFGSFRLYSVIKQVSDFFHRINRLKLIENVITDWKAKFSPSETLLLVDHLMLSMLEFGKMNGYPHTSSQIFLELQCIFRVLENNSLKEESIHLDKSLCKTSNLCRILVSYFSKQANMPQDMIGDLWNADIYILIRNYFCNSVKLSQTLQSSDMLSINDENSFIPLNALHQINELHLLSIFTNYSNVDIVSLGRILEGIDSSVLKIDQLMFILKIYLIYK
ncbi:hypothetical protein RF11_03478 [Thelohanellus kitauei]|uniref:Uncharacterized protein n=1 Tax=Thelohanellus kitauei TaxID=669202 RepID=A0A0C2IBH5_THEKT|nr:hypothetical protein RF11_03478 [Thelohanellus kitauei]